MTPAGLGPRIRAAMQRRGLTREAAARQLGTSPPSLRAWELGFNRPRADMLARIESWLREPARGRKRGGR